MILTVIVVALVIIGGGFQIFWVHGDLRGLNAIFKIVGLATLAGLIVTVKKVVDKARKDSKQLFGLES